MDPPPDATEATSKRSSADLLKPTIFNPIKEHKQTFIMLHGRGSRADLFAKPFLTRCLAISPDEHSDPITFQSSFPHAKFVVPTAKYQRAVVFNRSFTHQWFDAWTLDRPEFRQDLQQDGLKESVIFIHALLQTEIDIIGAENVILLGISQGCATLLVSLLTWQGEAIAAGIGMCGWLPFRKKIQASLKSEDEGDEDVFDRSQNEHSLEAKSSKIKQVADWLRDELELSNAGGVSEEVPLKLIPIYLGHGTKDEKVPLDLGRFAADFLKELEVDVRWNEYDGLGHEYSEEMLQDIVTCIDSLKGWGIEKPQTN
jgi:predicted esterase